MSNGSPLRVDIVSDVVCPWCAVGYYQLAAALREAEVEPEIHWHPFQLNPDIPPEGQNLADHLAAKYGTTREASLANRGRLAAMGAEVGFRFDFFDEMRTYNTFDAHRLLHWAGMQGAGHALNLALLAAYFTERRDVSDHATLVEVAASVGLDPDSAAAVLRDGRHADEVRALQRFWAQQGVRGVPAMVFDSRHLVTGAQGVETYGRILRQLTNSPAA